MRVTIIGGTGFVGSYLTDAFLEAGHEVTLLVRDGSERKVHEPDRVRVVAGDIASGEALGAAMEDASAVIYNVGILREMPRRGITFEATQYQGLVDTVAAATRAGVTRLLLMSAIGVKDPGTRYQQTKHRAEEYAFNSGLDVTVMRPSVIFGDPRGTMEIATQLYRDMIRPPIPAVAFFSGRSPETGTVRMSPVHVENVASAFVAALGNDATIGQRIELAGPESLTWTEIVKRIATVTGRSKWILPMPVWLMRIGATLFDWLPFYPVTRDQLTMLQEGNTGSPEALEALTGRQATPFTADNLGYLN